MKTKYTPGPWTAIDSCIYCVPDGNGPNEIARVSSYRGNIEANARLIAAAPIMAEMMHFAIAEIRDGQYLIAIKMLEDALNKALRG